MIKILFLIHDLGQGGAEKVLVNLVNNMDQSLFEVHVISLFGGGVNEQFLKPHVNYRVVFPSKFRGNSILMKLFSPKFLHWFCVKENYDIEVAYLEGPATRVVSGCQNPKVKLITWFHSMQFSMKEVSASFRSINEAKKAYEKFNTIVTVSQLMNNQINSLLHMDEKTMVIYNTIETDIIREQAKEPTEDIMPTSAIKLIATGTLKPIKGFDRLLRITHRILNEGIDIELYILGKGLLSDEFKAYIDQNNLNNHIFLLGYQVNPYKYLSQCDLFVCSSISEGFSTSVTEALIVGLPVITTEVSGMKEMLGDHNEYGVIVENDEESLYEGLKKLLLNPQMLQNYRKKAKERGAFFDKQVTVKSAEELFVNVYRG